MPVALDTVFDVSLARTQLARDVDHPLSQHGISLSDLAILRELRREPAGKLRRSELAQRLGLTPSGVQIVDEALQTAEAAAERALAARWSETERERLAKLLARS